MTTIIMGIDLDNTVFQGPGRSKTTMWNGGSSNYWKDIFKRLKSTIPDFRLAVITAKSKPDVRTTLFINTFYQYINYGCNYDPENQSEPQKFYYHFIAKNDTTIKLCSFDQRHSSICNEHTYSAIHTDIYIVSRPSNKFAALQHIAQHYRVSMQNVLHIDDNQDTTMQLQAQGVQVLLVDFDCSPQDEETKAHLTRTNIISTVDSMAFPPQPTQYTPLLIEGDDPPTSNCCHRCRRSWPCACCCTIL